MQNNETKIPISERVRNKWHDVLRSLGIPESHLMDKHGPCPMCGGKDRFRWDNKDGRGTYFCSGCGAGDGFKLLMKFKGWDFKTAATEIERITDLVSPVSIAKTEKKDPRIALRKIMSEARKVRQGDEVYRYLAERGLETMAETLWFHPALYESGTGKKFPAMVALVQAADGKNVSVHRTYLDGCKKADIESPRKIMPPFGTINGSSIRLFPIAKHLGIAEGIETAIAAYEVFNLPVWSVMNTNGMRSFIPPDGVREISVFADNDKNYAGQAAAYHLANKLVLDGFKAHVFVPDALGHDWLDVYLELQSKYHKETA